MKIGVIYPQTEYSTDPSAIRAFAETAEGLGYTHVLAYDHVLGASPDRPGGWRGPYTYRDPFLSPFLLFTYMAAFTTNLEFVTGILILPQRPTALVAKQAAVLDVLSGGRLKLGIGTGWNEVEYTALNQNFHTRGRRIEEQIELLRKLWTESLITYEGEWHNIPAAGLNPLPVQRPIPIWMGGHADVVLRRVARIGDGWIPFHRNPADAKTALEKLDGYLTAAGRTRDDITIQTRIYDTGGDAARWAALAAEYGEMGADYVALNTMGCGYDTDAAHLDALRQFAAAYG
ncbi:MAG: LLM class F420-dependent oxidoreductase, partial [Anaerolineales bacterium]